MIPAPTLTHAPRPYRKTGLYTARAALKRYGLRALDRRTRAARALLAWRQEIAADLGGADNLSAQQRAVLEEAVKLKLMLDSVDAWILAQPSLIDRRKRALLPVVKERQSLADALVRYLTTLGLERRARDVTDLRAYLTARVSGATTTEGAGVKSVKSPAADMTDGPPGDTGAVT